jgi:predicted SAM-dependent methyltransferase
MSKVKRQRITEPVETVVAEPAPYRLDLGCGNNKAEGYIGVDAVQTEQSNIVFDLNEKHWTFAADNSVDAIHCSHFIEHVDSLINFMNECHRILKPQAQMIVIAPYYSSVRCWQDPTHKNAISEMSFLYYNAEWRRQNRLEHYPITADFDFTYGYVFDQYWQLKSEEARAFALKYYINVVSDIQVALTKR